MDLEVHFAHILVVLARMVFREVVAQVEQAFIPKDSELVLQDAILDPIELHVV